MARDVDHDAQLIEALDWLNVHEVRLTRHGDLWAATLVGMAPQPSQLQPTMLEAVEVVVDGVIKQRAAPRPGLEHLPPLA